MLKTLNIIYKISRPRFWLYLAGPFLIGLASGLNSLTDLKDPWIYLLLIYFFLPANIYLYGINDYFDADTDKYNEKKEDKEIRLTEKLTKKLLKPLVLINLAISILIIIFIPGLQLKVLLSIFLFLATFYSTPPLRFKRYPIIDSLSNILYALPGFIAYYLVTKNFPGVGLLIAAWTWTIAMHLFSAIPDIEPDKQAGLKTTAILLGKKHSLLTCFILWLIFAFIIIGQGLLMPLSFLFLLYPLIPLLLLTTRWSLIKAYWYFPILTGLLGFSTFWYLVIIYFD